MDFIAPFFGGTILTGLAAAWRQHKFGRIIGNLVMSVQTGRQRLKDNKFDSALDLIDETLGSQTQEVVDIVRDTKKKLGIKPVS